MKTVGDLFGARKMQLPSVLDSAGVMKSPSLTLSRKCGSRYSFGYPACPNLEDQTKIFRLLEPEKNIGVRLTEQFHLEPEQSTNAIVVHHPQAKYFVV